MAVSSFQIYPEYASFTGVEIKLSVDGDDSQTFVISKIGEHLQSLVIKEGTVGTGSGQQFVTPNSGGIASGSVSLTDENNAIFLSLMASKTKEGKQLLNKLDITLKTYSGIKRYENCRINKWNCNFDGGCPTITLEWQSIGGSNAPSYSNPQQSSIDPVEAKKDLIDIGISSFADFKGYIGKIFKNPIKFQYTTKKVIDTDSLKDIGSDGSLKFFNDNDLVKGTLIIPKSYLLETSDKKYRFKLQVSDDATSLLANIMKEFCSIAQVKVSGDDKAENQNVEWKFLFGDTILIYTYKNMGEISIPEDNITKTALENSVFIYNTSFMQGDMYQTNSGMKRAFIIDSIGTSLDFSQVILANLSDHNNSVCPNGNIVMTSRGAITIPQEVPAEVAKRIKEIESFNLSQNFTVRIVVYNFVHFYVMGNTLIDLVVYDHLGNIHPITGRMRITGYQYDISVGGVVKATVTLAPPLSQTDSNFNGVSTSLPSYPSDSESGNLSLSSSENQGKADISIKDYNTGIKKEDLPNYLGIQVKRIDGAVFHQSEKPYRKPPEWVVVHYTAAPGASAKKETEYFAKTGRVVSTHFFCDSEGVYQVVDENHASWHCGSGKTQQPYNGKILSEKAINDRTKDNGDLSYEKSKSWRYDISSENHLNWSLKDSEIHDFIGGNLNSFGVDLCCKKGSKGSNVTDSDWYCTEETIDNCAKTVAYLCYKWDIPIYHVIRHADCTGKPCLPLYKTDILTPYGFVPLHEIRVGDAVYQYNKVTDSLEETVVKSVVKPYVATICKNREYETTLNHRTLYKDSNGEFHTEYLEDLLPRLNSGEDIFLYSMNEYGIFYPNYRLSNNRCYFYNTVVSCIEVPSGYIVIRQNKTSFITGNCPRPFVSLPSDGNFSNEKKWKLLQDSSGSIVNPGEGGFSTAYSYKKPGDIYLEEGIENPKDRTSFLGKVAGYMSILEKQGYPKARNKK